MINKDDFEKIEMRVVLENNDVVLLQAECQVKNGNRIA